jgi:hypothetical protein
VWTIRASLARRRFGALRALLPCGVRPATSVVTQLTVQSGAIAVPRQQRAKSRRRAGFLDIPRRRGTMRFQRVTGRPKALQENRLTRLGRCRNHHDPAARCRRLDQPNHACVRGCDPRRRSRIGSKAMWIRREKPPVRQTNPATSGEASRNRCSTNAHDFPSVRGAESGFVRS